MLNSVHPKLPMRNKSVTLDYYIGQLSFTQCGGDYEDYLMLKKDDIEIHFFKFEDLDPKENYGQIYIRTSQIESYYQSLLDKKVAIHPNAPLQIKPWGQKEFALLDPDSNLLTFGETST
ncbi:bleomycin resistance protein [Niabella ginsengisoli]|uniref:VOC family protein n=1 Tax=Niabella ginsengisoli TaxID=522298 RepID=A0ABS9SNQ9_9BACT|nr:VOC family protein [Niabella ginsengisoli]MCH5600038.1 VOC family protein [Niabella ginsengisoli]